MKRSLSRTAAAAALIRVAAAALIMVVCSCAQGRAPAPRAWDAIPLGTDAEFEDMWFADSLHGWIVGGSYQVVGGLVGRTDDGGRTWSYTSGLATKEPGVFRFNLEAVRFLSDRRGIVAADGGKIFATDDGGDNWRLVRFGQSSTDHIFDLDFIDDRNGWAVGLGGVLRTMDAGETWLPVARDDYSDSNRVSGHAIHFVDGLNGWLVGSHATFLRTRDGGLTWSAVPNPLRADEKPYLFDVTFADASHGWVVGDEGTILHTDDGGETWVRQETGVDGAKSAPKLERIQQANGVAVFDLGERTPSLFLTSARFLNADRGWAVGHFGANGRSLVLGTKNGGKTWSVEADVEGEELRALFLLDADHVWTVGDRVREGTQVILRRAAPAAAAAG